MDCRFDQDYLSRYLNHKLKTGDEELDLKKIKKHKKPNV